MRVAMMIDSLRIGGAQKLVARFVSAASKETVETTVISLHGNPAAPNLEEIRAAGADLKLFPSRSLLDIGRLRQLIDYLRAGQFDLVHTHLSYANILGCLAGYFAGIPVLATLHSTSHDPHQKARLVNRLEDLVLRIFASRIIAVGYTVAGRFQSRGSSRTADVIPNGVPDAVDLPPQERQILRREIAGDENRTIIISVGRFVQAKGYEDLIDAFAILHREHPGAVLVIAGVGNLFEKIKSRISELHLENAVHCLGARSDVSRLLAASDLYVSSSHWEGLPVALLEAMMAGLPVVATSVGDIPKVVTPETGVIVPPHKPECLADALIKMVSEPAQARAMGLAAQKRALEEYSLDTWINRLTSLYEETLASTSL